MALILNIDTATDYAGVCISDGENILAIAESQEQKNHASFVQPAIKKILFDAAIKPDLIDAIAVTQGPGSYTGLRVGMASAKGLCYALNKPLILINTLEVMALASIEKAKEDKLDIHGFLFCPMIDARRMEVFTALYNSELGNILAPCAMILDNQSFTSEFNKHRIVFSGSGINKLKEVVSHENAVFSNIIHSISQLSILSYQAFLQKKFAEIAYSEPYYLKEFFDPAKKNF